MVLKIVRNCFDALHEQSVRYCHWKSNEHLTSALNGKTDLDLLINPSDRSEFEKTIKTLGFKKFISQPTSNYPHFEDWLGFDEETGALCHLDVQYRLLIGRPHVKEYRFPIEKQILKNSQLHPKYNVFISNPVDEIILLMLRLYLKTDLFNIVDWTTGQGFFPNDMLREFHYLDNKTSIDQIKARTNDWFDNQESKSLLRFYNALKNRSFFSKLYIWKLARLQNKLIPHMSPLQTFMKHWKHRITLKLNSYFFRKKRKTLNRGLFVVFLGSDGAGKTNGSKDIVNWLNWKVSASRVYLGTSEGIVYLFRCLRKRINNLATMLNNFCAFFKLQTDFKKWSVFALPLGVLDAVIAGCRYRTIKHCLKRIKRGEIIVSDRYPQKEIRGYYDGPVLRNKVHTGLLFQIFTRLEEKYYKLMTDIKPDLVIKLIISFEVASQRRQSRSPSRLKKKCAATKKLHIGKKEIILDAEQPLNTVRNKARRAVWESILKAD